MGRRRSTADVRTSDGRSGRRRRRAFASAVGSVFVVTVTVASASWLAAGTGAGFSQARTAQALRTVTVEAAASLYPGGTGDLALTVANDNPYDINLTRVSPNGAATSGVAACDDPGNGVAFAEVSGTWLIPRNGSATVVLPGSVSMTESSPDACQGQRFSIPVALSGAQRTGPIAPRLTVDPASTGFADQQVGTTSPPQRFTVRNSGNAGTTDLAATLSDTNNFSIAANTCGQLAPGVSCAIDVVARPTARGVFPGELRVSAAGQTQVASFGVRGTQAVVVPTGNSFGSVAVGQSKVASLRVSNIGDAPSGPITSIRISSGSTTPEGTFTIQTSTCGAPLGPGAACNVDVRFTPPATGSFAGSLFVSANPGTSPTGNGATMSGAGV